MDINLKLDSILAKNRIIKTMSCDKAVEVLRQLEDNLVVGDGKLGLYGTGLEVEALLSFISKYTSHLKIDVCFDKNKRVYTYKDLIRNTEVYPIEHIMDMHVDYIILGSCVFRQTFLDNLASLGYRGKIVDLYSYLEEYIDDHFADYEMIYQTKQMYLKANGSEKIVLLQKLIKKYILLKDFVHAAYYIDIYSENQYPGYGCYDNLKKDIDWLLEEIEECIKERNKKDIIINWIDAISYYDVQEFPFLQKKCEEGVCFENAYTVMPWTTETLKTILSGEYPIEGKLFLRGDLNFQNTKLLKILMDNGYGFGYCGLPKLAKLFGESVIAPVSCYDNKSSGSLQKQWDALAVLCQRESPMCILIHTLRETHEPFICGEADTFIRFGSTKADWNQKECREQACISGEYINNQLAFYEKFYKKNAIEIYMSDHGRVGNCPMDESKIHIMLSVSGRNIKQDVIESMFSLVKFPDLIDTIISHDNNWDNLTENQVIIENLDAYNELIVRDTLSGRLSRDEMYQCRGIVTLKDKYFLYAYGREYYFTGHCFEENQIDNIEYNDRIMKLKDLCGNQFIDIFQYDKFKHSRLLYMDTNINLNYMKKEVSGKL